MKKLIVLTAVMVLSVLQSCKGEKETLNGKWEKQDFSYEIDIQCDCTDEDKEAIRALAEEGISSNAEAMVATTYLNFTKEGKVTGNILGEAVDGEYTISDNKLSIKTEETNGDFGIVKEGESTLLKYQLDKDELEKSNSTIELPNIGEVTLGMTDLNLVLAEAP